MRTVFAGAVLTLALVASASADDVEGTVIDVQAQGDSDGGSA